MFLIEIRRCVTFFFSVLFVEGWCADGFGAAYVFIAKFPQRELENACESYFWL